MSSSLKNLTINDTGYLALPASTTGNRPGTPTTGMTRFNSSNFTEEYYNGSTWVSKNPQIYNAQLILVGGGGGGGGNGPGAGGGGGGGGGGVVAGSFPIVTGVVYSASIGGGGSGGGSTPALAATVGTNSTFSAALGGVTSQQFTAYGGGPGQNAGNTSGPSNMNGGSGGGSTDGLTTYGVSIQTYQNGVFCYGGSGASASSASGGGGASGVTPLYPGAPGLPTNITGTTTYFGGGGGGNLQPGGLGGGGQSGGGGSPGINGTANTGGGGGDGYSPAPYLGGNGGSGVCIVSIPTRFYSGTTTGASTVVSTNGQFTIITFNAPGTFTG